MTIPPRIKEWWRLWWDELLIIVGVSTVICLVIWGVWHLFQTTPFPLEEGVVSGHSFREEYQETHDGGTTCWSRDESGACTFSTYNGDIHHTHCRGGCYEIQVDGCSNDRRGEEHCRKEWKSVSQFTYEDCRKGRLWKKNQSTCLSR